MKDVSTQKSIESINKISGKIKINTLVIDPATGQKVFILGELKNNLNVFQCMTGRLNKELIKWEFDYINISYERLVHYVPVEERATKEAFLVKEIVNESQKYISNNLEQTKDLARLGGENTAAVNGGLLTSTNKLSNLMNIFQL